MGRSPNTEYCQLLHVGHCFSGKLETTLEDGTRATILAGDSYAIPPGLPAATPEGAGHQAFAGAFTSGTGLVCQRDP